MSIFGNILNKIFHHAPATAAPAPSPAATADPAAPAPAAAPGVPSEPSEIAQPSVSSVDVGAVLATMAGMRSEGGGNYQTSIVDLLKLLELDSSLSARKDLAQELSVHAGPDGSAEQNIALHRAVMDKLAANGGIVPESLRQ